jgi:hypothetical protein
VGGNGFIYPFVHGFMVLAALKAGKAGLARTEMNKWVRLKGFAECYDPRTGIGYGCTRHALGAALYIKALEALHPTFS